jgi:hypothetical protein
MLFTFWTGSLVTEPGSVAAWRDRFPGFSLFNDEDVIPLFEHDWQRALYSRIRIPTCKSDIARIALLRNFGGFYCDAHTGPANGDRLAETLEYLSRFELVLFSCSWDPVFNFMNGVLAARRHAAILDLIITKAFDNIARHERLEAETSGHVPYDILHLTGSGVILNCVFDHTPAGWAIKPHLVETIGFVTLPSADSHGFSVASHNDYRRPGNHWTERQKSERLFLE